MNTRSFDNEILKRLVEVVPGFPTLDLYHAYDELVLVADEISTLEQEGHMNNVFDERRSDVDRHHSRSRDRLTSVLLKANYMIADIFLSRFIGSLHQKESMSFQSLISNGSLRLAPIREAAMRPAYCVSIYRNKLVAHYDVRRMGSYKTTKDGVRTLTPLPLDFQISEADASELIRLRSLYSTSENRLADLENRFELLTRLFYEVPVGAIRKLNRDRAIVNAIAERGGCESMSAQRIVGAVDEFCGAVVEAIC